MPRIDPYGFSVNFLAQAARVSRRRMLGALRRHGGEPVAALVALGEDALTAELVAAEARLLGPDGGRTYAAEYARRLERGRLRGARTAREATGRPRSDLPGRSMSTLLDDPPRWTVVDELTASEARRVARYASLLGHLAAGEISPRSFRRRVGSWRPIRSGYFLATADVALVLLEERREGGEDVFIYEGRRA